MTVNNKVNGVSRKPVKLVGAAVLIAAAVLVVVWLKVVRGSEDPASAMATFVAKRGPLVISVLESGAIKAKEQEVIRNEVEGRTTIVWIIPEGTRVSKGDLLLELDVSTMTDLRIDQQIKVQNADAAYINAQETLAITENQAKSDIELSELTLKFAQQDLTQYLEGQYPNLEIAAVNKVQEANEVLTRAKETLRWSETLYAEKYISETELLADRLSKTRSENSLTVAQNDLRLLQEFTKQREMDQLTSDVNQAEMALERTRRKAAANMAQAKAELSAKELEFGQQKVKLAKIEDQLGKAKRYATADGMVVYATSSRGGFGRDDRRPLADGVEVYERQELIYIPKSASSVAEVDVHEASLDKVRAGLPAVVTVDAIPGKKFVGTVARIAPLPNAQSMWMNPDLKVYTTNINLETNDPALRSGMSCKAEIIVEQYQDVVYVPVQAVLRVSGQPTVFVVDEGVVEERQVEIGLDNNSMVVIESGLSEGEIVLLTPPLKAATLGVGERVGGVADSNDPMAQRINEKLKAANEALPAEGVGGPPAQEPGRQMGPEGPDAGAAGRRRRGQDGFQMPSGEQMQQMRQRFENMTPEERQQEMEKMKQRFENMSPEEREQMRQRFGGRGRREGGRSGEEGQGPGPRDGQGQSPERNP
jgi:HlyD family secretion protein